VVTKITIISSYFVCINLWLNKLIKNLRRYLLILNLYKSDHISHMSKKKNIGLDRATVDVLREGDKETPGNVRRLFLERKAYAFRGVLTPKIFDKDLK
jgi:hypothetical protein